MAEAIKHADHVIGPSGDVLSLANLPAQNTRRWVPQRKAEIVAAVGGGLLSLPDACARYNISDEEFHAWAQAYRRYGLPGLQVRRLCNRLSGKDTH